MDVPLFQRFLLIPHEFLPEIGAIGRSFKLSFHPYKERMKRTPYATWEFFLVRAISGLRDGLELELFWVFTLATRTELTLGLLHDLDTFAGHLFHAMHQ